MLRAYFVSDIHIASPDSPRARLFLSFLKALSGSSHVTHLFLHGDMFDLIVSGHVHVRDDSQVAAGAGSFRSVNLGSWLDAPYYFRTDEGDGRFYELSEVA